MKIMKYLTAWFLIIIILIPLFTPFISAAESDESVINNGYIIYRYNKKTGGFSIETAEGHPKKDTDNNIPLLYKDDRAGSNGTSFVTVRIDGKDYIFGQEYGFWGFDSEVSEPVISEEGRLMTINWRIKDITVTKKIALTTDADSNTIGNVGLSFEVKNNGGKTVDIGIRVLLDTALGNKTDAPYMIVGENLSPTYVETEFSGDDIPSQIRNVDALANPTAVSYIIPTGFSSISAKPTKLIIGHWANLANTRYEYKADKYCDFTGYSNLFKTPDSAAAIYWENHTLGASQSYLAETLYGIGNFTSTDGDDFAGLNITTDRVELNGDKTAYLNDGLINVNVDLDNSLKDSGALTSVLIRLTVDDKDFELLQDEIYYKQYEKIDKGAIKSFNFKLRAKEQSMITAGRIYISVTGTKAASGGDETVETMAVKSVILPSVKTKYNKIKINEVSPKIVWTGGEKAVTLTGDMKEFNVLAVSDGWDLRLCHTTSDHDVLIEKKNIGFLDSGFNNMSFTTEEELVVGLYDIVFYFTDPTLVDTFGKSIKAKAQLQVSPDTKYRLRSYGIVSLVRSTIANNTDYDFFTFDSEGQYLKFYNGEISKTGAINGTVIEHDFGKDIDASIKHEILLTVRGDLREMEKLTEENKKQKYWQADFSDGDIIINNILSYEGSNPLEIYEENGKYIVKGDGLLKVVNSVNVWRSEWSFTVYKSLVTTLDKSRISSLPDKGSRLRLSLDGAAVMMQSLGGFLIDLKYGEMSSRWYDDSDGMVTYGIGFGGRISLPIKEEKSTVRTPGTGSGTGTGMGTGTGTGTGTGSGSGSGHGNKPTGMTDGQVTAEVNNVLFGEEAQIKNKKVVIDGVGFIGIDATVAFGLPRDLLGSLVSNAPGIAVSMTINTIDNIYEFAAGVNIRVIECEGLLAFKEVRIKNKDVIVPDKVEFYIHEGLAIPIVPPAVLCITGLGGGINGLADTMGGSFTSLPPITLILMMRLKAVGLLEGAFNARISLEGLSLNGSLTIDRLEKMLHINAGISARWVEPWSVSLYGDVNIIDGIIKGGLSVTIADNYFYGYIYADLCIPDSVPLIGGVMLAGVEAAVSDEFVGANVKILGFKYGVIYYWGGDVNFEKNIDLSSPGGRAGIRNTSLYTLKNDNCDITTYCGININELETSEYPILMSPPLGNGYELTATTVYNAEQQYAILLEIPYTGSGIPRAEDFYLVNPNGTRVDLTPADNEGNGSFLVQNRGADGKYIYISIMENGQNIMKSGSWSIYYKTPNITFGNIKAYGIDEIPELKPDGVSVTYNNAAPFNVGVSWDVTTPSAKNGMLDVYLTDDPDTDKIKDGDFIYAFVYTDTAAFSDAYSFFDKASVEMKKGEKLELTLSSAGYDENWSPVTLPVSGAEILIDGKKSGIMTDENGKAVIDFKNAGSCIISASSESKLLVPPVCAVSFQKDTALTPALIIIIAVAVILAAGVVIFVSKRKNK